MDSERSKCRSILKSAALFIGGLLLGTVFGVPLQSKVPESLAFTSQVIAAIAWPTVILVLFAVTFKDNIRSLLTRARQMKIKIMGIELALSIDTLLKELLPDRCVDIPPVTTLVTSALDAKQRIFREWQTVHDKLAEVYKNSTRKAPPTNYKTLASRLERYGILTDSKVWELVRNVRGIYWQTRRTPESQVSPDWARYYEQVVPLVMAAIEKVTTNPPSKHA